MADWSLVGGPGAAPGSTKSTAGAAAPNDFSIDSVGLLMSPGEASKAKAVSDKADELSVNNALLQKGNGILAYLADPTHDALLSFTGRLSSTTDSYIKDLVNFYNDNVVSSEKKIASDHDFTTGELRGIQAQVKAHVDGLTYTSQQFYLELQKALNDYNLYTSTWSQILKKLGDSIEQPLNAIH